MNGGLIGCHQSTMQKTICLHKFYGFNSLCFRDKLFKLKTLGDSNPNHQYCEPVNGYNDKGRKVVPQSVSKLRAHYGIFSIIAHGSVILITHIKPVCSQ